MKPGATNQCYEPGIRALPRQHPERHTPFRYAAL